MLLAGGVAELLGVPRPSRALTVPVPEEPFDVAQVVSVATTTEEHLRGRSRPDRRGLGRGPSGPCSPVGSRQACRASAGPAAQQGAEGDLQQQDEQPESAGLGEQQHEPKRERHQDRPQSTAKAPRRR